MTWNDIHIYSPVLDIQTAAYVLLPDPHVMGQMGGAPLPTLYLLHGLSDDYTMWMRQSRIEQYARHYRMAVVMPAVNRSFYTDMAHGAKYFTFVSRELPTALESYFPLEKSRAGRFAAGLSMGGYGAMKLGLCCPDRYGAVASLSGPLEIEKAYEDHSPQEKAFLRELDDIFGGREALERGEDKLSNLAEKLCCTPEKAPRIYVGCGTEDFLFDNNQSFVERFGQALSMKVHITEGASHSWDYWDGEISQVLTWLSLPKAENVW